MRRRCSATAPAGFHQKYIFQSHVTAQNWPMFTIHANIADFRRVSVSRKQPLSLSVLQQIQLRPTAGAGSSHWLGINLCFDLPVQPAPHVWALLRTHSKHELCYLHSGAGPALVFRPHMTTFETIKPGGSKLKAFGDQWLNQIWIIWLKNWPRKTTILPPDLNVGRCAPRQR